MVDFVTRGKGDGKQRKRPVESAEQATEIGVAFLARYYQFLEPLKVRKEGPFWLVEVDTGAFYPQVAKVKIDVATGAIVEMERPVAPTR